MIMRTFHGHPKLLTTAAIALILLLLTPAVANAQATYDGTISGTVINQTTEQPVADIEVTLSAFTSDGMVGEFVATTDDSGSFEFTDVDTSDGIVYAASVTYKGVLYGSGMIRFQGGQEQTTEIVVFETTTDRSVVTVNSRGLVLSELDPQTGTATMLDIFSLEVEGEQTFVAGDTGRSVEFPLPRNAGRPSLLPGFDFGTAEIESSLLYATSPLRPDGASATLSYPVQYTGTSFTVDVKHVYPTETFRILIPTNIAGDSSAISVSAAGMVDEGIATIGEQEYRVWTATDILQDATIRVSIGSLPESQFEPNELRILEPTLLAGVALLAATAATVVIVRRKKFVPADTDVTRAVTAGFVESRDELVVQLQELQDEYENGMIEEEIYISERRALLERLRVVSRHLRSESTPESN